MSSTFLKASFESNMLNIAFVMGNRERHKSGKTAIALCKGFRHIYIDAPTLTIGSAIASTVQSHLQRERATGYF